MWEEVPALLDFDHAIQVLGYSRRNERRLCPVVRFKNRPPDLCAEGYKVDENGKGLAGWTVEAFSSGRIRPRC